MDSEFENEPVAVAGGASVCGYCTGASDQGGEDQ